jgi:RES domain-containing protein
MAARPCESTFAGAVYRQSSPRYAEITERTLLASFGTGGRFNPAGEFGALYVSLDPETPFRELSRQATKAGLDVLDLLPRTLFAAEARLQKVLDLACIAPPADYRISPARLRSEDWRACQEVARRARQAGFEAIRFPPRAQARTWRSFLIGSRPARTSGSSARRRFAPTWPDERRTERKRRHPAWDAAALPSTCQNAVHSHGSPNSVNSVDSV